MSNVLNVRSMIKPQPKFHNNLIGPFNKDSIISIMKELGGLIETKNMVIGFGGALCLKGLRDSTSDIDILFDQKLTKKLLKLGGVRIVENGSGTNQSKIEIIRIGDLDFHITSLDFLPSDIAKSEFGDFKVTTLECILRYKKKWNRPKDQEDIKMLEKKLNII